MDSSAPRHTRACDPSLPCETRPVISVILGHQGGWDEALMVLVPIALFIGLLSLANKRAKAIQAKRLKEQESSAASDPSTPGSDS
jgi:hypothetical protein